MMFRDRSAAYQALGVVLILGLLTGTPFSGVTFADELTGIRLLEEIQNVFITLADRVKPAEVMRSEEHTSELQSRLHLVCRLLLEKKKIKKIWHDSVKYSDVLAV